MVVLGDFGAFPHDEIYILYYFYGYLRFVLFALLYTIHSPISQVGNDINLINKLYYSEGHLHPSNQSAFPTGYLSFK